MKRRLVVALFTVKQVAERLGVSPGLVYALCARKRIRHERHGLGRGKLLIPEDALEEYRRRQTVGAEPEGRAELPAPRPEPVRLQHLRLKPS
jgi:excisionase family DNA binding protein